METSTPNESPLRQRMIEDMRMRKLMPRTREAYIRAALKFENFWADRLTQPPTKTCAVFNCI